MSSDFSDNSGPPSSVCAGKEPGLSVLAGRNTLKPASPLGLASPEATETPPAPPGGCWVSAAARHFLPAEPATSSRAEPARLCHLSVTVFILRPGLCLLLPPPSFSLSLSLALPPFLSNFLHSSFVSTPALRIPHIEPHGHDNPHYVFMSCSLLSLSPFLYVALLPSPLFSLLPSLPDLGGLRLKKKEKKIL